MYVGIINRARSETNHQQSTKLDSLRLWNYSACNQAAMPAGIPRVPTVSRTKNSGIYASRLLIVILIYFAYLSRSINLIVQAVDVDDIALVRRLVAVAEVMNDLEREQFIEDICALCAVLPDLVRARPLILFSLSC